MVDKKTIGAILLIGAGGFFAYQQFKPSDDEDPFSFIGGGGTVQLGKKSPQDYPSITYAPTNIDVGGDRTFTLLSDLNAGTSKKETNSTPESISKSSGGSTNFKFTPPTYSEGKNKITTPQSYIDFITAPAKKNTKPADIFKAVDFAQTQAVKGGISSTGLNDSVSAKGQPSTSSSTKKQQSESKPKVFDFYAGAL